MAVETTGAATREILGHDVGGQGQHRHRLRGLAGLARTQALGGLDRARAAAAVLSGDNSHSFTGADMSTKLKLLGVDVGSIGDAHGVSLAAVATRWVLDQPQVAGAIVGARYARHLPKTLEVFQFALTDTDRAAIAAILDQSAGPNGPVFGLEGDRSGRHGRIMKYNLNTNPNDAVHGARSA